LEQYYDQYQISTEVSVEVSAVQIQNTTYIHIPQY
jgi:hypothetical protein